MRTTLSIDEALLQHLEEVAVEIDSPLKDVLDKALRAGLEGMRRGTKQKSYQDRTFSLGTPEPR